MLDRLNRAIPLTLALILIGQPVHGVQAGSSFTTRDSAGVRIVMSSRPDTTAQARWSVSDTAEVSVGQVEGAEEYLLHRVTDVVRLDDGTLVVANAEGTELRLFDSAAQHRVIQKRNRDPANGYCAANGYQTATANRSRRLARLGGAGLTIDTLSVN